MFWGNASRPRSIGWLFRGNASLPRDNGWFFRDNASLPRSSGWFFQGNGLLPRSNGRLSRDNVSLPRSNGWLFWGNASLSRSIGWFFRGNASLLRGNGWFFWGNASRPRSNGRFFRGNASLPRGNGWFFRGNDSMPRSPCSIFWGNGHSSTRRDRCCKIKSQLDRSSLFGRRYIMRQFRVIAVLIVTLLPAAAHAQDGVVLKSLPIPVGTKYKLVRGSVTEMDMESTAAGKSMRGHMEEREAMSYSAEVLAANDVGETRLRVRFLQSDKTSRKPGADAPEKKVDPVAGKTYLVTAADGMPRVTSADGRAVSEEETKKVQATFSDLGHRDPVCAALVGRTLTPGEAVAVDPSVVRNSLRLEEGVKFEVDSLTVKLREVRKRKSMPVAVFDVAVRFHGGAEGGMSMALQASGTAEYGLNNCWVVQEETRGPMSIAGSAPGAGQQTVAMKGQGNVLSITRVDYP